MPNPDSYLASSQARPVRVAATSIHGNASSEPPPSPCLGSSSGLNAFDCGSANVLLRDSNFLINLNPYRPAAYPTFIQASVDASKP